MVEIREVPPEDVILAVTILPPRSRFYVRL
jgi:hypothetical protein